MDALKSRDRFAGLDEICDYINVDSYGMVLHLVKLTVDLNLV